LIRFHKKKFDGMLCKVDASKYARSLEQNPTLPYRVTPGHRNWQMETAIWNLASFLHCALKPTGSDLGSFSMIFLMIFLMILSVKFLIFSMKFLIFSMKISIFSMNFCNDFLHDFLNDS